MMSEIIKKIIVRIIASFAKNIDFSADVIDVLPNFIDSPANFIDSPANFIDSPVSFSIISDILKSSLSISF